MNRKLHIKISNFGKGGLFIVKRTTSLFVTLLVLVTVFLTGCGGPSEMALWFVSLYPDLGPSYVNLILGGRLSDSNLEMLAESNLSTEDLEKQIIDLALLDNWDEFREVGFLDHPNWAISHLNSKLSGIRFYPYIGYDKDSYWAFIRATYSGKDWIFFDHVIVLVGDQRYVTQELPFYSDYVKREVNWNGGGVTEQVDFPLSHKDTRALAYAIAYAEEDEEIRVRFVGEKNRTFTLPMEVRWVWQDMIKYFDRVTQM